MPKRPKKSDDSFNQKIAKIIQFKEECMALIKRYDEEGVALDSTGERRILQLQKWRAEMVQAEEYLARHIQYDDAEYDEDEPENLQTKIVIYETGLEPLNALLTRFINVRQEDGGYGVLHPNDLDCMIKKIRKRNKCPLIDAIVPKDTERYWLWKKEIIEHVKFRIRLERLGLDYDNFEAVYGDAEAPCTSDDASIGSEDRKEKAREGYMRLANRLGEMVEQGEIVEENENDIEEVEDLLEDGQYGDGSSSDEDGSGVATHITDEVVLSTDDEAQAEMAGPSKNSPGPSRQVVGQSKGHFVDDDDATESENEDPAANRLAKASHDLSYILKPDSNADVIDLSDSDDNACTDDDDIIVIEGPCEKGQHKTNEANENELPDISVPKGDKGDVPDADDNLSKRSNAPIVRKI